MTMMTTSFTLDLNFGVEVNTDMFSICHSHLYHLIFQLAICKLVGNLTNAAPAWPVSDIIPTQLSACCILFESLME